MSLVCSPLQPIPLPLALPVPLAFSLEQHTHTQEEQEQRKRTSSFSLPAPAAKLQRISMTQTLTRSSSSLRRTETLLHIVSASSPSSAASESSNSTSPSDQQHLPYYRTLQYYKDQRLKRRAVLNPDSPPNTNTTPQQQSGWIPSSSISNLAARKSQASLAPLVLSTSSPATPTAKAKPRRVNATTRTPITTPTTPTTTTTPANNNKRQPARSSTPSPSRAILPLLLPRNPHNTPRTSSPLTQSPLTPSRPHIPVSENPRTLPTSSSSSSTPTPPPRRPRQRSKPDPSSTLYKKAIKAHMGSTPEGRRVLHMGPRLAMSIACATRELERIVNSQSYLCMAGDDEMDVVMGEGDADADAEGEEDRDMGMGMGGRRDMGKSGAGTVLTSSWVVVRGEDRDRDWEMVDCAA